MTPDASANRAKRNSDRVVPASAYSWTRRRGRPAWSASEGSGDRGVVMPLPLELARRDRLFELAERAGITLVD